MTNFTVKSQLAKLLATENISIRHDPNARTASFDVKDRLLTLPVWQNISEDLYDMLVVHEVGHALDTPYQGWIDTITALTEKHHGNKDHKAKSAIKNFLNVVEDARIDKRQKRRYPGSRRNYIAGYKELLDRNFFGIMGKDVNELTFIDRINLYFKGGVSLNIQFSNAEKAFVSRIEAAETFDEVVILTDEVYAFALHNKQNEPEIDNDDIDWDYDAESEDLIPGEGESEDTEETDNVSDIETEQSSSDDDDATESDDDADSYGDEYDEDQDDDSEGPVNQDEDEVIPDSETEKAAQEALKSIVQNADMNYIYVTMPKPIYKNIVDDFSVVIPQMEASWGHSLYNMSREKARSELMEFRRTENDAISFMVKEFEMRKSADTYARATVAKTGVIDTNKLHSFKYNDDIFRKLSVVPAGKNHGFFMILDWSGSMIDNFAYTIKQLIALTLFCKRVQIPFEVYAFRDATGNEHAQQYEYKAGDLMFGNFKLRNVLSSRMNAAMLNRAFECLWAVGKKCHFYSDPMNGTPLNQSLIVAEKLVNDFRKKYKLQIVSTIILTDGVAEPPSQVYENPVTKLPVKPMGNYYILTDEVTKRIYNLGSSYYHDTTPLLLSILRERTNTNLIGFLLIRGPLRSVSYLCDANNQKNIDAWKKDGYVTLTSQGYDEYYIIKSADENAALTLNVDAKMTKAKIAKEFIRYSGKKGTSRVLLSKFMKRACTIKLVA